MSNKQDETNEQVTDAWTEAFRVTITPMLEKWAAGGASFSPGAGAYSQTDVGMENNAAIMLQMIAEELLEFRLQQQEFMNEQAYLQVVQAELEEWRSGQRTLSSTPRSSEVQTETVVP